MGLVGVRETGLMWANMLRAFQVGKALTSDGEPSSWMRPSRVAWAQVSWPACLDEDLYITAEAEAFVKWHAGQLTWAQATREGRIQLDGPSALVRAFPTWNARSMFAHIRPVSRTPTSPAG